MRVVDLNEPPSGHSLTSIEEGALTPSVMVGRSDPSNSDGDRRVGVCMCVSVHVRECVRACVRDVFAIYDNNS